MIGVLFGPVRTGPVLRGMAMQCKARNIIFKGREGPVMSGQAWSVLGRQGINKNDRNI